MTPIVVQTCEDRATAGRTHPYCPGEDGRLALFSVQDPFGARKAVVPLFWMEPDGDLQGFGTAFALDPWGALMTADHVVAAARDGARQSAREDGGVLVHGPVDAGFVAVLGYGVVFGTVGLPREALAPVVGAWSPGLPGNDPLARLQGRADLRPLDLALLRARLATPGWARCLPMRSRPPRPRIGEAVVALGFPRIDTFRGGPDAARTVVEEGMFAACGRVLDLLPRGRDRSNPTPVFEVEAHWPSGMSGGPVLNSAGEVIGLVSRSLEPEGGAEVGVGWATWLEAFPRLPAWAPTLDETNVDWRRGWALIGGRPWRLAAVFPTEAEADAALPALGTGISKLFGAWRLGTDEFVGA